MRKLDELSGKEIPEPFLCPITQEIMKDPCIATDGHTYDREAIERWFKQNYTEVISPMTGAPITDRALLPNYSLKSQIQEFLTKFKTSAQIIGSTSPIFSASKSPSSSEQSDETIEEQRSLGV